jgi:carboxymethylenebutenolidase
MTEIQPKKEFLLNRRSFVMTSVAAGFAAAVSPVHGEPIHTDDSKIVTKKVLIPVRDGQLPAYQAHPQGNGPFPVVLVVQEIFGVHEYIQDVVRRFAHEGYYAIAPDLYARQGDPTKIQSIQTLFTDIVSKVPDEQVLLDLDETLAYVEKSTTGNVKNVAITGFCWGGRIVWLYAAHNPKLKAGVAWYGMLAAPLWNPNGTQVLSLANSLKAPVLGLYGGKDANITKEHVHEMQEKLKGTHSEIILYENADHGFHADYRPTYNEEAAKDGWKRLLHWFSHHGLEAKPV